MLFYVKESPVAARMRNFASFIGNVPLFKSLSVVQLEKLAHITTTKTLKKGEVVFSEGEKADGFYVVVRGRVKIYKLSSEGKEQVLHIVGFSEPFGEVPVFSGGRFPANAQAIEEVLLMFFPDLHLLNSSKAIHPLH